MGTQGTESNETPTVAGTQGLTQELTHSQYHEHDDEEEENALETQLN
jgi:hypothetical protein